MENKDEKIVLGLKDRARSNIKYGSLTVKFTIHDGVIVKGEVLEEKISLG